MSLGEPVALEEAEEGRMAKPIRSPILPSPEEIEAHKVSHIPFRSWCSHCVRGRGKSYSHHRVTRASDPEEVPVVSIRLWIFRFAWRTSCRCCRRSENASSDHA